MYSFIPHYSELLMIYSKIKKNAISVPGSMHVQPVEQVYSPLVRVSLAVTFHMQADFAVGIKFRTFNSGSYLLLLLIAEKSGYVHGKSVSIKLQCIRLKYGQYPSHTDTAEQIKLIIGILCFAFKIVAEGFGKGFCKFKSPENGEKRFFTDVLIP